MNRFAQGVLAGSAALAVGVMGQSEAGAASYTPPSSLSGDSSSVAEASSFIEVTDSRTGAKFVIGYRGGFYVIDFVSKADPRSVAFYKADGTRWSSDLHGTYRGLIYAGACLVVGGNAQGAAAPLFVGDNGMRQHTDAPPQVVRNNAADTCPPVFPRGIGGNTLPSVGDMTR